MIPVALILVTSLALNILNPVTIWIPLILILALWYVVLMLWERANYVFGLEWCIAKIADGLIRMDAESADRDKKVMRNYHGGKLND